MKNVSNNVLAAGIGICSLLLVGGNLMVVNALQTCHFNTAILHAVCGVAVGIAVWLSGSRRLIKIAPYLLAGLVLLLLMCPIFGRFVNGACRWLSVGGISFAPAFWAMPVLVLFWAYMLKNSPEGFSRKNWAILIAAVVLLAVLVGIEPFVSMAGFIVVLGLILAILAGCGRKQSLMGGAVLILAAAAVAPWRRLLKFYGNLFRPDYDTQYHTWNLLTTLKYSVFCGSHQVPEKLPYHIPNAVSDAALAAGCGEFGFIFLIAALFLMAGIAVCGIVVAKRCASPAERLLAGGLTAAVALPALTNMLMMFGLVPMGGVAFPFLAYGGSAMVANAAAIGCIMSIARKKSGEG